MERLTLAIDGVPRFIQPAAYLWSLRARMGGHVIHDGKPEGRHTVARTPKGEPQGASAVHAHSHGPAQYLHELFANRVGISGACASITLPV